MKIPIKKLCIIHGALARRNDKIKIIKQWITIASFNFMNSCMNTTNQKETESLYFKIDTT
jgi:hypothetical protein